jgi:hypothetical protein
VLSRSGRAIDLTKDHKPAEPSERQRIELCGGFVCAEGLLCGELAVARAIGDFHLPELKGCCSSGEAAAAAVCSSSSVQQQQCAAAAVVCPLGLPLCWCCVVPAFSPVAPASSHTPCPCSGCYCEGQAPESARQLHESGMSQVSRITRACHACQACCTCQPAARAMA